MTKFIHFIILVSIYYLVFTSCYLDFRFYFDEIMKSIQIFFYQDHICTFYIHVDYSLSCVISTHNMESNWPDLISALIQVMMDEVVRTR